MHLAKVAEEAAAAQSIQRVYREEAAAIRAAAMDEAMAAPTEKNELTYAAAWRQARARGAELGLCDADVKTDAADVKTDAEITPADGDLAEIWIGHGFL